MTYTYEFERGISEGDYLINNKNYIDGEGNKIYLANKVAETFINDNFKIFCLETICKIIFERDLSQQEQQTLETIVTNYKNYLP